MTPEHVEHLKTPCKVCVVCDAPLYLTMVGDYHGDARCDACGTSYSALGCTYNEDWLKEGGLTKKDVKNPSCNQFELVPMLRDYWKQTGRPGPFGGCFFGGKDPLREHRKAFWLWLAERESTYRPRHPDEFDWEKLREQVEQEKLALQGAGI